MIKNPKFTIEECRYVAHTRKGLCISQEYSGSKKLDALKDKLCLDNNITLIRVPYFLKDKEFYEKIVEGLRAIYKEDYWMIIRAMETGVPVPQDVVQARAEARAKIVHV